MSTSVAPAYLERIRGRTDFEHVELRQEEVTIGRSPDCTYNWRQPTVSRKHATFKFEQGNWLLKNTSTNKVLLNFIPLPKDLFISLQNEDIVTFKLPHDVNYRFVDGDLAANSEDESQNMQFQTVISAISAFANVPANSNRLTLESRRKSGIATPASQQKGQENFVQLDNSRTAKSYGPALRGDAPREWGYSGRGDEVQNYTKEFEEWAGFQRMSDLYWVKMQMRRYKDRIESLEKEKIEALEEIRRETRDVLQSLLDLEDEKRAFGAQILEHIRFESDLECGICKRILTRATTTDCGHTFCLGCVQEKMRGEADCPKCRQPLRSVIRVHAIENYAGQFFTPLIKELEQPLTYDQGTA